MGDKKRTLIILVSSLVVLGLICGLAWIYVFSVSEKLVEKDQIVDANYYTGTVKSCAINPIFPKKYDMDPPFFIDLRQKGFRGLRIIEYKENGKVLQLPSWSEFGWLGLYTMDYQGNIFLSSVPNESIEHNPVGEQNRVLKLDGVSGLLTNFIDLPQASPSTLRNPFGAMGLHYDCDNKHLYVSSVAGSGIKNEVGRIYQIDLDNKKIISSLEGRDAIGLCTYNTKEGKRLYFGLARKAEVHSILLDANGSFLGEARKEFSLLEQPGGAFDKAHKISIRDDIMEIRANAFNFTLAASSDPQTNVYHFRFNDNEDNWAFLNVKMEQVKK